MGFLWHRDGFRTTPDKTYFFWGHSGTFGAGLGVTVFLNERLFVAPGVRLGWEPFLRSTVSAGYRC